MNPFLWIIVGGSILFGGRPTPSKHPVCMFFAFLMPMLLIFGAGLICNFVEKGNCSALQAWSWVGVYVAIFSLLGLADEDSHGVSFLGFGFLVWIVLGAIFGLSWVEILFYCIVAIVVGILLWGILSAIVQMCRQRFCKPTESAEEWYARKLAWEPGPMTDGQTPPPVVETLPPAPTDFRCEIACLLEKFVPFVPSNPNSFLHYCQMLRILNNNVRTLDLVGYWSLDNRRRAEITNLPTSPKDYGDGGTVDYYTMIQALQDTVDALVGVGRQNFFARKSLGYTVDALAECLKNETNYAPSLNEE